MKWIRGLIQADRDIPSGTRLDLLAAIERLQTMDANDTRTVAGWEHIKKAAPKVWEKMKPVRDALMGEAVKKALEGLLEG